ncbi:MAG TPA: hypothetical protein PLW97_13210 [Synergistaceae bacterium]|nr:hypothetical protein [Synergistaceae bacterium]
MKEELRRLLSDKSENVWPLPEWMLPEEDLDDLRREPSLGIVEIAGKDSIAAAVAEGNSRRFSGMLPTVAYTGTQYGDWEAPFRAVEELRKRLPSKVRLYSLVTLGSPELWRNLCGKGLCQWQKRYGFASPCTACHLYFHVLRVPLARHLGSSLLLGGERASHDGKIKLSQLALSLDIFRDFLGSYGVELLMPLRDMRDTSEIDRILGGNYREGGEQLRCVLSGNYVEKEGEVFFRKEAVKAFFEEYALPLTEAWLREKLSF